jgi:hypothetical protein
LLYGGGNNNNNNNNNKYKNVIQKEAEKKLKYKNPSIEIHHDNTQ